MLPGRGLQFEVLRGGEGDVAGAEVVVGGVGLVLAEELVLAGAGAGG